jgi:hypothetical protein
MNPFDSRKPTTEQVEMMERFRAALKDMNTLIEEIPYGSHNSKYIYNAFDKLEEVGMWANRAITFYDKEHEERVFPSLDGHGIIFHDGPEPDCDAEPGTTCSECTCGGNQPMADFILPAVGDFMNGGVPGVMTVEAADEAEPG